LFPCICLRKVSGSGIPGVGVAPGLKGFLIFAASGIPGVGVPLGTLLASFGSGIPGVVFADGAIGLVEKPGGKLFASTLTLPAPTTEFAFALVFDSAELHADIKAAEDKRKRLTKTLDIKLKTSSI